MSLRRRYKGSEPGSDHASEQFKLGSRYLGSHAGDRAANLERAIACFTEALRFFTAEAAPLDYAMTQVNLGAAYALAPHRGPGGQPGAGHYLLHPRAAVLHRRGRPARLRPDPEQPGPRLLRAAHWDRAANLARAIGCYIEALRFRTAEAAPADYAMTQNGLGAAYAALPAGDRAANLAQAITCYTHALRFFTAEACPSEYAGIQNNLGTAYVELPTGDRGENLRRAIACYRGAAVLYAEAAPLD